MNRRSMLKATGSAAAITILGGIPLNLSAASAVKPVPAKDRKKILVIGAHPDDPETAAGGTMCLLSDAGHEVVSVYLTRGEAGIRGKSHDEAAAIREAEARAAWARSVYLPNMVSPHFLPFGRSQHGRRGIPGPLPVFLDNGGGAG